MQSQTATQHRMETSMGRNRKFAMLGSAILGAMMFAGAAAPAMAAETAPVQKTQHADVQAAPEGAPVKAIALAVATQITNTSNVPVTLDVTGYDMSGHRKVTLRPGQSQQVFGHSYTGHDIEGTMTYPDGTQVPFWLNNPYIGQPIAGFGDGSNWDRYDETERHTRVEAGHSFKVVREADQVWQTMPMKLFTIAIAS